jgi:phenylpropionate dioxygenase-like ring-hydroxylating dioxygenase large terminal subunit
MARPTADDWRTRPAPPWKLPQIGSHPIPGHRYTSRDFFAREWEQMWTKVWLLLGRESEIPQPGDWQMEEVGPESFLMVRQDDGSVKAFYNVCQHRGNRLVFHDQGNVDHFVCAYHGWAWHRSGRLDWVKDEEDFPQGSPCRALRLREVRCETFAGFVWVNMDDACVTLREYLGPVWDDWSMYPIASMRRYLARSVRMPNNWKVIQDNFNESYHLRAVHPESNRSIEESYKDTQFDMCAEGHSRMIMKSGSPSKSLEGTRLQEPLISMLREWDLDPDSFRGREEEARLALQHQKRKLGPSRGYAHYEKLRDEQLTDFYHYTVFPNFAVSVTADGFHFLRSRPHATDPEKCVFDNWFYAVDPPGDASPVFTPAGAVPRGQDAQYEIFDYMEKSLGFAMDQDMSITSGQQLGFRSRGYTGVYLSGQEARIRRYHEVIDEYLGGKRPARAR